ncbi:MAG: hypothetical protein ABSF34_21660 [Verrucomicrobiota bacterium]
MKMLKAFSCELSPAGGLKFRLAQINLFKFSGSQGSDALYQARLYWLRKNSCFVSGHDFSRAVNGWADEGFSPWVFLLRPGEKKPCTLKLSAGTNFVRDTPWQGLKPNLFSSLRRD